MFMLELLGCLGMILGRSWSGLGRSWGGLGAILAGLGAVLRRLVPLLGRSWAVLGRCWDGLGRSLGGLGASQNVTRFPFLLRQVLSGEASGVFLATFYFVFRTVLSFARISSHKYL